jgi:translocation and assembly module TamB
VNPLLRRSLWTLATLAMLVLLALGTLAALVSTGAGSRWAVARAWALAGDTGLDVRVGSSAGTLLRGMQASDLQLQLDGNTIHVTSLEARWNPFSLLSGTFVLDSLHLQGLRVDWTSATGPAAAPPGADPFASVLPLPMALRLQAFTLEQATLAVNGQVQQIEQLALSASLDGTQLSIADLQLQAAPLQLNGSLQADLSGNISLRSVLDWQYAMDLGNGLAAPAGSLALSGNLVTLGLSHQLHSPLQVDTQGSPVLNLLQGGTGQRMGLTHTLSSQSLAALLPGSALSLQIRDAEISTNGWLDDLQLSGLGALLVLNSEGAVVLNDLALRWNALLTGTTLQIDQLSASTASGSLSTTGELAWSDGLRAALTYTLRETDASRYAALLPEGVLPGELSSTGNVILSLQDDAMAADLVIDSLEGSLNDYPLSGSGALSYSDAGLSLNALRLRSGPNSLQLDGAWADTLALRASVEAPQLRALSPLLDGSLNASAEIAGTPAAPQLTLSASGAALRLGETRIAQLQGEGRYSNGSNSLVLNASALESGAFTASSLMLRGEGLADSHRLTLLLDSPDLQADIALSGALDGLAADETLHWQGTLERGSLDSELGLWRLVQPTAIAWSASEFTLGAQCWEQALSTLCMDAAQGNSGTLQANATLRAFDLQRFNARPDDAGPRWLPALPASSQVSGRLNASVQVTGQAGAALEDLALVVALNIDEGALEIVSAADTGNEGADTTAALRRFELRTATVDARRESLAWSASSVLEFAQPAGPGAGLQGTARTRLSVAPDGALDGRVDLQFDALQWVEALVPALTQVEGRLSGLATLGGTLDDPQLSGTLTLLDGALEVPALGLQLQALSATLLSDNSERLAIEGQATSGTGTLTFFSSIDNPLSESRQLRLTLQGENVTLVERPELRMAISPDLTVVASAQGVDIAGTLALPLLDVQITTLPESAVDVSADTVLVVQPTDGPDVRNAAETRLNSLDGLPLTAQISLQLGEDVHFAGWGLDTDLSGTLEITQRATGAPLTYGELTVTQGSYQTYGRTLNIEHGKLLFFGSYDNPALDIRATRETDEVKVGVQMNGTLRNIRSQLFSTPTLPDGDIIAVMLTGRPLAEMGSQDSNALVGAITTLGINQGQNLTNQVRNQLGLDTLAITSTGDVANSSLTLGKYLTPRIFIQYGIGLFETESTLAVDYTLSERVKLEAKSGSTQSLDITYTVER